MHEMGLKQLVTNIDGTGNIVQMTSWIMGLLQSFKKARYTKLQIAFISTRRNQQ